MRKVVFETSSLTSDFVEFYRWPRVDDGPIIPESIQIQRTPIYSTSIAVVDGVTLDFRLAIVEPVYQDPESPIRVIISDVGLQARRLERVYEGEILARLIQAEAWSLRVERLLRQERADRSARDEAQEARAYRESWAERWIEDV